MYLVVVLAVVGCDGDAGTGDEVTSTKPYADLVGARYSVIADGLYAYGVYDPSDNETIRYVELVPMGIGGREFAFRRDVQKGQVITILSAWSQAILFGSRVYYLVAVENSDLPSGVPVRLGLSRGNEGAGVDLNPAIYKRLPIDN